MGSIDEFTSFDDGVESNNLVRDFETHCNVLNGQASSHQRVEMPEVIKRLPVPAPLSKADEDLGIKSGPSTSHQNEKFRFNRENFRALNNSFDSDSDVSSPMLRRRGKNSRVGSLSSTKCSLAVDIVEEYSVFPESSSLRSAAESSSSIADPGTSEEDGERKNRQLSRTGRKTPSCHPRDRLGSRHSSSSSVSYYCNGRDGPISGSLMRHPDHGHHRHHLSRPATPCTRSVTPLGWNPTKDEFEKYKRSATPLGFCPGKCSSLLHQHAVTPVGLNQKEDGNKKHRRSCTPILRTNSEDLLHENERRSASSLRPTAAEPKTSCNSNSHYKESILDRCDTLLTNSRSGNCPKPSQNFVGVPHLSSSKLEIISAGHLGLDSSYTHSKNCRSLLSNKQSHSVVAAAPTASKAPNIFEDPRSISVSFSGCGFLGIYHVGVAACLKKFAPHLLQNRIAGASAGALAGALILCNADLGVITSSVLKTATEARARALGPFSPTFDVEKLLREGLLTVLPANAHEIVSGRLFVSVTRISDGKNILLSHFDSREELVQYLVASAFIPGYSGYSVPTINHEGYVDGGPSLNQPRLDARTISVTPFAGNGDICPSDEAEDLTKPDEFIVDQLQRLFGGQKISLANTSIEISRENMQRFARILFPPPPETLSKMCQQGFNDALDFLQRNNLIACTRCVAVQSTVPLDASPEAVAAKEELERLRREKIMAHQQRQRIVKERDWTELSRDSLNSEDDLSDCYDEWEMDCKDCADCRHQRQMAILDELPATVGAVLQEAIEVADAGVAHWAALSATAKLVSLLALPATYSLKLPIAVFRGMSYAVGVDAFLAKLAHKDSFEWSTEDLRDLTLCTLVSLAAWWFAADVKGYKNGDMYGDSEVGRIQRSMWRRRKETSADHRARAMRYGIWILSKRKSWYRIRERLASCNCSFSASIREKYPGHQNCCLACAGSCTDALCCDPGCPDARGMCDGLCSEPGYCDFKPTACSGRCSQVGCCDSRRRQAVCRVRGARRCADPHCSKEHSSGGGTSDSGVHSRERNEFQQFGNSNERRLARTSSSQCRGGDAHKTLYHHKAYCGHKCRSRQYPEIEARNIHHFIRSSCHKQVAPFKSQVDFRLDAPPSDPCFKTVKFLKTCLGFCTLSGILSCSVVTSANKSMMVSYTASTLTMKKISEAVGVFGLPKVVMTFKNPHAFFEKLLTLIKTDRRFSGCGRVLDKDRVWPVLAIMNIHR